MSVASFTQKSNELVAELRERAERAQAFSLSDEEVKLLQTQIREAIIMFRVFQEELDMEIEWAKAGL
jgi:hypothetical protein